MEISKVLMCAPTYFDIEYVINPWMDTNNRVNKERAWQQWEHVRDVLRDLGGNTFGPGSSVARVLALAFGAATPTGGADDPVASVLGARYVGAGDRYGDADLRLGQCRLHLGRDDQCGMDHYPHGRDRDGQRQRHLFRAGQYRICSNGYADGCRTGRHHFAECAVHLQHFTDEHLD